MPLDVIVHHTSRKLALLFPFLEGFSTCLETDSINLTEFGESERLELLIKSRRKISTLSWEDVYLSTALTWTGMAVYKQPGVALASIRGRTEATLDERKGQCSAYNPQTATSRNDPTY